MIYGTAYEWEEHVWRMRALVEIFLCIPFLPGRSHDIFVPLL